LFLFFPKLLLFLFKQQIRTTAMPQESASRRHFLRDTTCLLGGGWLASHGLLVFAAAEKAQQAKVAQSPFNQLTEAEAQTLTALTDQIFPPDDLPGASQLGAVHFIDAAMGSFMSGLLPVLRQGVVDLNELSGQGKTFHELGFDEQTGLVKEIEKTPFFGQVHFLTLCGLFALPSYGGNSNREAWKMMGFESQHVWHHPFGYYDSKPAEEAEHDRS
jgi:gluconate 2-dehydrogenase gamma chain